MINTDSLSSVTKTRQNVFLFLCMTVLWFIFPFLSIFIFLYLIGKYRLSNRQLSYVQFLISCTFGLLAYTQQSLSNTDVSRYYAMFEPFVDMDLNLANYFLLTDSLAYTFTPISVFLTSLFKNVQVVSGFWVFISYQFYFMGLRNYLQIRNISLSSRQMSFILGISVFGLILFTQVSELLKQGAAISFFFYVYTYFLKTGNKWQTFILLFLDIGIHFSQMIFVPLFFIKRFNRKILLTLLPFCLIFLFIDVTTIVSNLLPTSGWLGAIQSKASEFTENADDVYTLRYIFTALVLFISAWFLDKCTASWGRSLAVRIAYLYCALLLIISSDGISFLRFTTLSYWVYAVVIVELLAVKSKFIRTKQLFLIGLSAFVIYSFLLMTYGRTIKPGGYITSYLNNDPVKILTYSVPQYLLFDASQQF